MIAITNDVGETLQLTPGQNLVTEQNVAWLSDEELPGEFSYPIDVPLNESNQRFVQHGYRPDAAQPRTELPVTVRMDGVLYRRCTFSFRVNSGKLSGYLKIDSSEFYDRIRKLTLLEALTDVVFLGDGFTTRHPVSLQNRLQQVAALPPGQFPCTFFPIRNEAMLEESFTADKLPGFKRNAYLNAWEPLPGGGVGFPVDLPNTPTFGYLLCPQFYLSYVLERIITHLAGYRIESEWLASAEVQALTIKNLTAMSLVSNSLADQVEGHRLVPGLFLPDMSVSDFLKAVKGKFGLVFTYNANDKVCRITQFVETVAAGPAIDLTPFQSGDYSTQLPDGKGYSVSDYVDDADELYKDATGKPLTPPMQLIGKGQQVVSLKAGTCQLVNEKSPLGEGAYWFVPTVRQAGNVLDPAYKASDRSLDKDGKRPNPVGLCFLSYRGMSLDSKNNPYPLATPDVRNGHQQIVGQQALTLTGQAGAWRSYLRAYYYFRDQTQMITQELLMPVSVLASLRLDRTVSLSLADFIRRSYLISKVQADAPGIDGKARVRLEVLTLPSGIGQPADAAGPLVWVELVGQPVSRHDADSGGFIQIDSTRSTFTLRFWKDAVRSTPAMVNSLPVLVRRKSTGKPTPSNPADSTYSETIVTYVGVGSSTLIETALLIREVDYARPPVNTNLVDYTLLLSLDPGEGYNILNP